ncbi:PIN domain-containing protein [Streptomyces sp. NPDC020707]|uniref:PIN domain-containing protein n=1 Tax=Streptomyces sp. NPDC020707 TaxID=3365084 RepID=UPI0037B53BDB
MIILDTSILRSFSPDSDSADLLRAIRALNVERVVVPWMVLEELVAQQAVKYRDKHERALQAVEALSLATPWAFDVSVGFCDLEGVRTHWRHQWLDIVDQIPTSDEALRQALFREANNLAPCRVVKDLKIGARDAAIWLSAVETARHNPDETVYFVSANTNDFGAGEPYPSPMDEDLFGLEERFVHLTSMDEVAAQFAEPTSTDQALAESLLASNKANSAVTYATYESVPLPIDGSFQCTIAADLAGNYNVIPAIGWMTVMAQFEAIESIQTYRIGNREWCTAVVRWMLSGVVPGPARKAAWAACSWTTAVLFTLESQKPGLTVLRAQTPRPLTVAEFEELHLPTQRMTEAEMAAVSEMYDVRRWPDSFHPSNALRNMLTEREEWHNKLEPPAN